MRLEKVRMLASEILKCGMDRVWLDPEKADRFKSVMTREDVRGLIKDNVIKRKKINLKSSGRAKILREKRKRGRKRGWGKRKGSRNARMEKKPHWMKNVRSQRAMLQSLRKEMPEAVAKFGYRRLYKMVKGGYFKGKNYLKAAVEAQKA